MGYSGEDRTGTVGANWAAEWQRTDRTFAPLTARLVTAVLEALPATDSGKRIRILDLGCGAGETAIAIAKGRADVDVTGLDFAPDLVAVARDRGDGIANCRFVHGDASIWRDGARFDAALSRHGVMFFAQPAAAFAHVRTLLQPGAPLTFTCFRDRADNDWVREISALLPLTPASDPDLPGPFAFADSDRVARILSGAGWHDVAAEAVDYDYVPGEGDDPVSDAAQFFARIGPAAPAIRALDNAHRAEFDSDLRALLARHCTGNRVRFTAAAWLWRAKA